jgi:OOP family OmpA-OmpF porin
MTMKPFRVSLIAGAMTMTGFAFAAAPGYVISDRGEVARSGTGECVRSSQWTPLDATVQCDPDITTSFAPVQLEPIEEAQAQAPMSRITLDTDTTFAFDSAELTDQGKQKLDEIVDASRNAERMQVQVAGHTDRIGPEDYNQDLSLRRAEAVKEYLVSEGIPEESISVAALGESNPIVQCEGMSGDTLIQCLQPNRRSEVEFAAFAPADTQQQEDVQR